MASLFSCLLQREICSAVSPGKDIDGLQAINVGQTCLDQFSMWPATPWGVWEIIKRLGILTLGKNMLVAGRSKSVGMPIALLRHTDGAHARLGGDAAVNSLSSVHSQRAAGETYNSCRYCGLLCKHSKSDHSRYDQGRSSHYWCGNKQNSRCFTAKPKLVGDVDFEGVRKKSGYLCATPVPGSVGAIEVVMLMKNHYCCKKAAETWRARSAEV